MVKVKIRYKKEDTKILDGNESTSDCGEESMLLSCPRKRLQDEVDLEADSIKREKERIKQLQQQVKQKALNKKIKDAQKDLQKP
jgi:hypothetical protein